MTDSDPIRPRYGQVKHLDGSTTLVIFVPSELENTYRAVTASTEKSVLLAKGETIQVLGKMYLDQALLIQFEGYEGERLCRIKKRGKELVAVAEKKEDIKFPWGAVLTMAALAGVGLLFLWGIKVIFWGA